MYITTKKGAKLSYFYSGDLQSRRHIIGSRKKNDCFSFNTKQEAENYINYIKSEIPKQAERWGNEITRQVSIYVNNLVIS